MSDRVDIESMIAYLLSEHETYKLSDGEVAVIVEALEEYRVNLIG